MKNTCIAVVLLLFSEVCISQQKYSGFNSGADSMLNFILANKSRTCLFIQRNGRVIGKLNENKVVPVGSTVKMMIAVEFAKQAGAEVINEDKYVALSELEKYYLPNTDGGAHPKWIEYERSKNHIRDDSVKLIDIARGMIMFNSDANMEYLVDILGFDNVKNNIQLFGLKRHSAIYPLVSSFFMYQNPHKLKEEKVIKEIQSLTEQQYCKYIFKVHQQLKWDSSYKTKNKFYADSLSLRMQKLWSDRLPSATARDYVKICATLNNRNYFDENTYGVLADVLETFMENVSNRKQLKHAGFKGGATKFLVTEAMYLTLKDNSKYEMAIFVNDLQGQEYASVQNWMEDFRIKILTNEPFRNRLRAITF